MSTRWVPIGEPPALACVYSPNLAELQRAVGERGFDGLDERERAAVLALPWGEFNRLVQRYATTHRRKP